MHQMLPGVWRNSLSRYFQASQLASFGGVGSLALIVCHVALHGRCARELCAAPGAVGLRRSARLLTLVP